MPPEIEITKVHIHENRYCIIYRFYPEGETVLITAGTNQIHFPPDSIRIRNNTEVLKTVMLQVIDGDIILTEQLSLNPGEEIGNTRDFYLDMETDKTIQVVTRWTRPVWDTKTVPIYRGMLLTIRPSVGEGETEPPAGTYIIHKNSEVTVKAIPAEGYIFYCWLLNGETPTQNPITVLMDTDKTLTPIFAVPAILTVNSDPFQGIIFQINGETAETPCEKQLVPGSTVTLTMPERAIHPETGEPYRFSYWEDGSTNPNRTLHILTDTTVTAYYEPVPYYTLTIEECIGGSTEPPAGTYHYEEDTQIQVTAIPDEHFSFSHWLLNGEEHTENPITILMDSNHTLEAIFTETPKHTLTINIEPAEGGTTQPEPGEYTFYEDESVEVLAIPAEDYRFDHWLLDGEVRTENPTTVLMDKDYMLTAVFKPIPTYTLTITVNDPAMGTTEPPPGEYTHLESTSVPVTAIPKEGYTLAYWLLDGANIGNPLTVTIHMDADHTLQAVFQEIGYATVQGVVKGLFGRPVKGANLTLNTKRTTSKTDGSYEFTEIKCPQSYLLKAEHWLYETVEIPLIIEKPEIYILDVNMPIKKLYIAIIAGSTIGLTTALSLIKKGGK